MVYFRVSFLILAAAVASACVRHDDNVVLPAGHPAEADARPGVVLSSSQTLEPELKTIKPDIQPSAAPQTPSKPAGQRQH